MGETLATPVRGGTVTFEHYLRYRNEIDVELDRIKPMWERRWTKQFIHEAVIRGMWQAWFFMSDDVIRMTVYTQVVDYPAARVLWVPLAFGNSLDEMLPVMEATLEKFGQEMGCDECEIIGRKGWGRKLGPRFTEQAVLLTATIPPAVIH